MGGGGMPPPYARVHSVSKIIEPYRTGWPPKVWVYRQGSSLESTAATGRLVIASGGTPPLSVGFAASSPRGRAKWGGFCSWVRFVLAWFFLFPGICGLQNGGRFGIMGSRKFIGGERIRLCTI